MLKLVSWNVNGLRAVLKKDFIKSIQELNPDILCLQEIKTHEPIDEEIKQLGFKDELWNCAERKGYSGTAVFTKVKPLNVTYGIGLLDEEGRVVTCEFEKFYLVNVYTPNSKRQLERLDFRYEEWDVRFLDHIKNLEKNKPVIFCGDLNVAHTEVDLKNPQSNKTTEKKPGNAGFTDKERERFTDILDAGFIDTFRYLKPKEEKYSWWTYMFKAREKNVGWRIDYFIISPKLLDYLNDAEIHNDIYGSDHCPVSVQFNF